MTMPIGSQFMRMGYNTCTKDTWHNASKDQNPKSTVTVDHVHSIFKLKDKYIEYVTKINNAYDSWYPNNYFILG